MDVGEDLNYVPTVKNPKSPKGFLTAKERCTEQFLQHLVDLYDIHLSMQIFIYNVSYNTSINDGLEYKLYQQCLVNIYTLQGAGKRTLFFFSRVRSCKQ